MSLIAKDPKHAEQGDIRYYDEFNVQEYLTMWKTEKFEENLHTKIDQTSGPYRTQSNLQYSFHVREVDRQLYDSKSKTFLTVPHIQIVLQVCGDTINDSNMIWLELAMLPNNSQATLYSQKELFDLSKVEREMVFVDMWIKKSEIMSNNYLLNGAFTLKCVVKEIVAFDNYSEN